MGSWEEVKREIKEAFFCGGSSSALGDCLFVYFLVEHRSTIFPLDTEVLSKVDRSTFLALPLLYLSLNWNNFFFPKKKNLIPKLAIFHVCKVQHFRSPISLWITAQSFLVFANTITRKKISLLLTNHKSVLMVLFNMFCDNIKTKTPLQAFGSNNLQSTMQTG